MRINASSNGLCTLAHVKHFFAHQTVFGSAYTSPVLVLASCLAFCLAVGDDERGEPADERRAT